MKERKTLTISLEAYSALAKHGKFGESFSDLISRLVDEVEKKKK